MLHARGALVGRTIKVRGSFSTLNPTKLHGKTALITGASEGVGRAIAETLSQYQMNLALISRSRDKLEQVAENITKAGSKALVLNIDDTPSGNLIVLNGMNMGFTSFKNL